MLTLAYHQTMYTKASMPYLDDMYRQAGPGGKFWIDASIALGGNRFQPRTGDFSIPYKHIIPEGFERPLYDPNFNMSFEEVTDLEAQRLAKRIDEEDCKVAVYYSGGMDSVAVLGSLLRNLSERQLKNVYCCMSLDSIIEYPTFFREKIAGRINVLDSATVRYHDILNQPDWYVISADLGDAIFGTDLGMKFYHKFQNTLLFLPKHEQKRMNDLYHSEDPLAMHYSEYKPALLAYLDVHRNPDFSEQLYYKMEKNIKSVEMPIHSVHDWFWWFMFNTKYMHCSSRAPAYMFDGTGEERKEVVHKKLIHWFNTVEYQKWSMANNNNGQKIRYLTPSTYKFAAREYIERCYGDTWFRNFKIKIASLKVIWDQGSSSFIGYDENYELVTLQNPRVREEYKQSIVDYEIDWM